MIEIAVYGRGGQGAITSAELLATAAFKDGKYSQAFPYFGVERRGAPVMAFVRIDKKFIRLRQQVYNPKYAIVLDYSLLNVINVTRNLREDGMIIVNSNVKPMLNTRANVCIVNATKIAMEIFGKPIINTIILGAFSNATNEVSIKSLEEAIKEKFEKDVAEKNIIALKKAAKICMV